MTYIFHFLVGFFVDIVPKIKQSLSIFVRAGFVRFLYALFVACVRSKSDLCLIHLFCRHLYLSWAYVLIIYENNKQEEDCGNEETKRGERERKRQRKKDAMENSGFWKKDLKNEPQQNGQKCIYLSDSVKILVPLFGVFVRR